MHPGSGGRDKFATKKPCSGGRDKFDARGIGLVTQSLKILTQKTKNKPRINWIHDKRPGNVMDNEIRLGTWNVRTLLQPGKREQLFDALNQTKVDIAAL